MTEQEYIDLIREFGFVYNDDMLTYTAYYNKYPICGYRMEASNFPEYNWKDKSLIIYGNYSSKPHFNGKYSGIYNGKYSDNIEEARKLITKQIKVIKKIYYTKKLKKLKEDFK